MNPCPTPLRPPVDVAPDPDLLVETPDASTRRRLMQIGGFFAALAITLVAVMTVIVVGATHGPDAPPMTRTEFIADVRAGDPVYEWMDGDTLVRLAEDTCSALKAGATPDSIDNTPLDEPATRDGFKRLVRDGQRAFCPELHTRWP